MQLLIALDSRVRGNDVRRARRNPPVMVILRSIGFPLAMAILRSIGFLRTRD